MGWLSWIVVGLIAGAFAKSVTGYKRSGCVFTVAVGILGGLIGGALFNAAGSRPIGDFGLWALFVSFIGATLLLLVLKAVERR
ncbi:MAG: GlsB/YeaQ/YmgE family stress response membrane protein [Acidimicrobiia bacterium]